MPLDPLAQVPHRLRSAAGHLRAVAGMAASGADPRLVVSQLGAVESAVRAARRVLIVHILAEHFGAHAGLAELDLCGAELEQLAEALQPPRRRLKLKGEIVE